MGHDYWVDPLPPADWRTLVPSSQHLSVVQGDLAEQ